MKIYAVGGSVEGKFRTYLVGGAVRDQLLGREVKDRDYVVVGATPEHMISLGYSQVGETFPVFLHPVTQEEYALARTERKTGVGYNGFSVVFDPEVTLEEDLIRRDLTINAMAQDLETGELIDLYGGQHDLARGILRHTSVAFAEDSVRVLRTARFAARYNFEVAEDTIELMKAIVHEIDTIPADRIVAEFAKGLSEENPSKMFDVLNACNAGQSKLIAPYLRSHDYERALDDIDSSDSVLVRMALATSKFTDKEFVDGRIPLVAIKLSKAVHKNFDDWIDADLVMSNQKFVELCTRVRAFSDPVLFNQCKAVIDVYLRSVVGRFGDLNSYHWNQRVSQRFQQAANVDAAVIAASTTDGKLINKLITEARIRAMT